MYTGGRSYKWVARVWTQVLLNPKPIFVPHNAANGEPDGCVNPESLTIHPWTTLFSIVHSPPLLYLPTSNLESSFGQQR
jgi:hypothetical protein